MGQIAVGLVFSGIIYVAYLVCFTAEVGGVLPFLVLAIGPFVGLAAGWWLGAEEVDEE